MFIELFIDYISYVTTILHAVIHSGDGLGISIVVLIDNPVNPVRAIIAIRAIYPIHTFYNMDIGRGAVFAIDADMAVGAVGSVLPYRRNGDTVFAIRTFHADGPVNTVCAVFALAAHGNGIRLQILVQADDQVSICIHHGLNVGSIIFRVRFRTSSFDGHGAVQFFGH